jgi:hypothetical protein
MYYSMNNRTIIIIILVAVAVVTTLIGLGTGYYFYTKYQKTQALYRDPNFLSQQGSKTLVENVGKLIQLPTNEEPTIATVTDLSKLSTQPFFIHAKVGDRVLLYPKNQKAILYDPVENIIVEVGPLILPTPTATASSSAALTLSGTPAVETGGTVTPSPTLLRITILNGTKVATASESVNQLILSQPALYKLVRKGNAVNRDYATTVVIDLAGTKPIETAKVTKLVGGEISALPSAENKPAGTDILVIVGNDKLQ